MGQVDDQPGWVLHLRPWRETSAIVEIFTRDLGRVGLVVRGIRGPKRQPLRAALQPLCLVACDFRLAGELGQLRQAEALMAPLGLSGDRLMAGFYLAELVVRLLPRQEASPALFTTFGDSLAALADQEALGWTLRCFERDLLRASGMAPPLDRDAHGDPLHAEASYRIEPEQGLLPQPPNAVGGVPGSALLALAAGQAPGAQAQRDLKRVLRTLLAHQLGPRGLRSWDILRDLPRSQ